MNLDTYPHRLVKPLLELEKTCDLAAEHKLLLNLGETLLTHITGILFGEYKRNWNVNEALEAEFYRNAKKKPSFGVFLSLLRLLMKAEGQSVCDEYFDKERLSSSLRVRHELWALEERSGEQGLDSGFKESLEPWKRDGPLLRSPGWNSSTLLWQFGTPMPIRRRRQRTHWETGLWEMNTTDWSILWWRMPWPNWFQDSPFWAPIVLCWSRNSMTNSTREASWRKSGRRRRNWHWNWVMRTWISSIPTSVIFWIRITSCSVSSIRPKFPRWIHRLPNRSLKKRKRRWWNPSWWIWSGRNWKTGWLISWSIWCSRIQL